MTPEDTPRDALPQDGSTVHLRPQYSPPPPPDTSTVQLGGGRGSGYGTPMPAFEATPTVFVPTPPPGEQPEPESLIRFGPGVPDPRTARTMAVWQGAGPAGAAAEAAGPGKGRKRTVGGFALAGIVLLLVVAFLLWQRFGGSLAVGSVAVTAGPAALACDGTETITAVVRTNGSSGTIRYHWVRSDGTDSGMLTQSVRSGLREVPLPLRWTVQGNGNLQATATLEIVEPSAHTAAANFNYSCSK